MTLIKDILVTYSGDLRSGRDGRKKKKKGKNQGMGRHLILMNISCRKIFLTPYIASCSPVAVHVLEYRKQRNLWLFWCFPLTPE